LRFEIEPFNLNNVKKEFKFCLNQIPGELKIDGINEEETIFRFDFIRSIFLERGL
jgi:hypothetical protein